MPESRIQQRPSALMSADVVGYSRLMGNDEVGTLSALKELRATLCPEEEGGIDPA